MKASMPNFLTSAEAARLMGRHRTYVCNMCRTGQLPAIRRGSVYFIPVEAVRLYQRWQEAKEDFRRYSERARDALARMEYEPDLEVQE